MKRYFQLLPVAILFACCNLYAQEPDSLKQAHVKYLTKELSVTDAKARQVAAIMDDYKTKAKILEADTRLNQDKLRIKFDALIADKNTKLEKLLTEEQLQKIVPISERTKN